MDKTIQDIVSASVVFSSSKPNDWCKVYCAVCGDGSRTKGPRGGWLFNEETASYHCFNCNISGTFDPNREFPFSKDMRKILDAFGINKQDYNAVAYKNVLTPLKATTKPSAQIIIPTMEIPKHFYLLSKANSDNVIASKARSYLNGRKIDPDSYPFYLSTGVSKESPRDEAIAKVLLGRLIIPFFKKDKMIYYQARDMGESKQRYINADGKKGNVIFNYDQLFMNQNYPLFILEGIFDAMLLNGVAVLENHMTKNQIEIISRSPRKKILVPDKFSDSSSLIDQCIEQNWCVSTPDIGQCKDVNESILKYGKLYTARTIMNNIHPAEDAKIALKNSGFYK